MSMGLLSEINDYANGVVSALNGINRGSIEDAIETLMKAREAGNTVYIFGNGGSAATASHCVCDFNKGVSVDLDKKFKFECLSDNMATMMAIANDYGYEDVFYLQLRDRLKEGDVVFGISGSGNSKNVIKAVEYAKRCGNEIISLTGYSGGRLLELSDHPIHVNVNNMQIAEDTHMIMCHMMASIIAKRLGHPMC